MPQPMPFAAATVFAAIFFLFDPPSFA